MHLTLTISQKERFPLPTSEQCPGTSSSALLQAFMKFLFSYREHPVCIKKEEVFCFELIWNIMFCINIKPKEFTSIYLLNFIIFNFVNHLKDTEYENS